MDNYSVWFLRRDGEILGSFPDAVIAQHMVLGRVREGDEVSLDTHSWHKPDEVLALRQAVNNLIGVGNGEKAEDPEWRQERMRAAVRWLDERKAPDRRTTEEAEVAAKWAAMRGNKERRVNPESPEILAYRKQRAVIEASLRRPRRSYTWVTVTIVLIIVAVIVYAINSDPVEPYHINWESLLNP
jgi:hypothetical protein